MRYRRERKDWIRTEDCSNRLAVVKSSPENRQIARDPGAGSVRDGWVTMHNGLRVKWDGYYGAKGNPLLTENLGLHEPQEEYLFGEIVRKLRPDSTMLELGAYWGFYSMWFQKLLPEGRCILVESESKNLAVGRDNFSENNMSGHFLEGFVGEIHDPARTPPQLSVDGILNDLDCKHLTLLHADIQSAEFNMLIGARKALLAKAIDVLFISTHSNQLHYRCINLLSSFGYSIDYSIDLLDSYSFDGLIVATHSSAPLCKGLSVSLRGKTS